jgi:hypothetical protein
MDWHTSVGAYIETYNDLRNNTDKEKEYHISNIKQCIRILKRIYPGVKISGFYLSRTQDEKIA